MVYGVLVDENSVMVHERAKLTYSEFWNSWKDIYMKHLYGIDLNHIQTPNNVKKISKLDGDYEWNRWYVAFSEDFDTYSDTFKIQREYEFKRDLILKNLDINVMAYDYPVYPNYIIYIKSSMFKVDTKNLCAVDIDIINQNMRSWKTEIINFAEKLGLNKTEINPQLYLINFNSYYAQMKN